ncbi:RNA recognition motif domain-containing protein [Phormidium sp. CCY1219]|uniref:RNA recognition motif domain-containing protein n=1 Tax=Phormidium sp. CCY1219 TaxID=2886104 RepID=UPI002D1F6A16|nr:RNA-binding protein [Phormidium sp. CCY1219]MEB3831050.1 RNA-binding protein [Phormidium sp. CCY1219]
MSIRLYVGNLPKEVDRQELQEVFAEAEPVSTKVITDRKTGKCRGFGFVTVKNDEQADQFIEKFNGYMFQDNALKIEKALPRKKNKGGEENTPKPSKPGSGEGRSKSKRSGGGSSSAPSQDSVQPDPRWADELAKLKEMLAAQTSNS